MSDRLLLVKDTELHGGCSQDPLLCLLCSEIFEAPCLLQCFHSFCERCLRGRAVEQWVICPLCGKDTQLETGSLVPPKDLIMEFMVDFFKEEKAICANCDKNNLPMFYCNTCNQPLCYSCRTLTHQAKMFQQHDVIELSKRVRDVHKICGIHQEPYIMFSLEKNCMLCINCFCDADIAERSRCFDLETAYCNARAKLLHSFKAIRKLQSSTRMGIVTYRTLLDQLKESARNEKLAIESLCSALQNSLVKTRANLLADMDNQFEQKESLFKSQLSHLGVLLPTLHVYLVICSSFMASANKYEFLSIAYMLMERLSTICQKSNSVHPLQNSHITTSYKQEFARCLQGLLDMHIGLYNSNRDILPEIQKSFTFSRQELKREECGETFCEVAEAKVNVEVKPCKNWRSLVRKMKSSDGPFIGHCRSYEPEYLEFRQDFHQLKDMVQNLHRDLTVRHCLAGTIEINHLFKVCFAMEERISQQQHFLAGACDELKNYWAMCRQAIAAEEETYEVQVQEMEIFQKENEYILRILRQLRPYLENLCSVLSTKHTAGEHSDQLKEKEAIMTKIGEQPRTEALREEKINKDSYPSLPSNALLICIKEKSNLSYDLLSKETRHKIITKNVSNYNCKQPADNTKLCSATVDVDNAACINNCASIIGRPNLSNSNMEMTKEKEKMGAGNDASTDRTMNLGVGSHRIVRHETLLHDARVKGNNASSKALPRVSFQES